MLPARRREAIRAMDEEYQRQLQRQDSERQEHERRQRQDEEIRRQQQEDEQKRRDSELTAVHLAFFQHGCSICGEEPASQPGGLGTACYARVHSGDTSTQEPGRPPDLPIVPPWELASPQESVPAKQDAGL